MTSDDTFDFIEDTPVPPDVRESIRAHVASLRESVYLRLVPEGFAAVPPPADLPAMLAAHLHLPDGATRPVRLHRRDAAGACWLAVEGVPQTLEVFALLQVRRAAETVLLDYDHRTMTAVYADAAAPPRPGTTVEGICNGRDLKVGWVPLELTHRGRLKFIIEVGLPPATDPTVTVRLDVPGRETERAEILLVKLDDVWVGEVVFEGLAKKCAEWRLTISRPSAEELEPLVAIPPEHVGPDDIYFFNLPLALPAAADATYLRVRSRAETRSPPAGRLNTVVTHEENKWPEQMELYSGILKPYVMRLTDRTSVDDVVQESLLRVWKWHRKNPEKTPPSASFIYKIATNIVLEWGRKQVGRGVRKHHNVALSDDRAAELPDHAEPPMTDADLRTRVAAAFERVGGRLPPNRAAVLRLYLLENLPPSEIALRLQMPLPTVKSHCQKGKEVLRDDPDLQRLYEYYA
jgi:RNA polymerase sigma-70 factor (ECF subfamily)